MIQQLPNNFLQPSKLGAWSFLMRSISRQRVLSQKSAVTCNVPQQPRSTRKLQRVFSHQIPALPEGRAHSKVISDETPGVSVLEGAERVGRSDKSEADRIKRASPLHRHHHLEDMTDYSITKNVRCHMRFFSLPSMRT